MSIRMLLVIIVAVPALLLCGAALLGARIPLPHWGRAYVLSFALDPHNSPVELPEIAGPDDPSRPLIVIDPGHGGRDPGSVVAGESGNAQTVREKDLVLSLSLALRDLLLDEGGIRVAMTREDDRIIPLANRPEIARQLGADLFLSVHADSAGDRSNVAGASVYTLSREASSEAAARFAERENAADELNGIAIEGESEAVSNILVELSQARTQEQSAEFARLIIREGEGEIAFHPEPRRRAVLAVLRAPDVPGVLFESGFVTNADDRARLMTEDGRGTYAEALARAIRVYFARQSDR